MQPGNYPYPPPKPRGSSNAIVIILVALGLAVPIMGVLATLAIYGVRKYIANAKTAEARNSLGQIAKDEVAVFDATGIPGHKGGFVCGSASRSVPASLAYVSGKKYQSTPDDWAVDAPRKAGFACLKFSMDMPQYYMYSYSSTPTSFTAVANGDLNGDGVSSTFSLHGALTGGVLAADPNIVEKDPEQ